MDTNKILGPEVEGQERSLAKPQKQAHTLQMSMDHHVRPVLDTFSCIHCMEFPQQGKADYPYFTDEETISQRGR